MNQGALDFTFVAVTALMQPEGYIKVGTHRLEPIALPRSDPRAARGGGRMTGQDVFVTQHAGGALKATRTHCIEEVQGSFVFYDEPTAPGASGAPVFHGRWELLAIHNQKHTADRYVRPPSTHC